MALLPKSGSSRGTLSSDVQPDTLERPRTRWLDLGKTWRRAIPLRMAVRPQRIRTYLVLFALALSLPLLCVSVFGLYRMASTEESQTDSRNSGFHEEPGR